MVLDGTVHEAGHFHVLHGSGGAYLDILSAGTGFHYFLLLYKAALISSGRAELAMRMEESNPTQAVLPGLNPTSVWVLSGGEMGVNLIFVQRNHLVCPLYQWGNRFKLFIDNENRYH
ncbi:hypothetical protein Back11_04040 [Paenibacillus baekrokdamisoli]|uniref:Uncharacterized protein n=1 Tax=Paenibacillus baekrokdamisoli TaxID=1712516 RepID=A0A3G9J7T9_9BACL|nr:hypothetical protein Back11_04040 [Paenibacillus baekrokdamisoli]